MSENKTEYIISFDPGTLIREANGVLDVTFIFKKLDPQHAVSLFNWIARKRNATCAVLIQIQNGQYILIDEYHADAAKVEATADVSSPTAGSRHWPVKTSR